MAYMPTCESRKEGDYGRLVGWFAGRKGAVVAFSGGVDSSLVLAAARDALGEKVLAVTACSATYPEHEQAWAVEVARMLQARHELVIPGEMEDERYRANSPDRCCLCKQALFRALGTVAAREGISLIVTGDNLEDYRPGRAAAREFGVLSPLAELGFGKDKVRALARSRNLPNWNRPADACLASRLPYGQEITPERLRRVAEAEEAIRKLGFSMVRVRDHGALARVEVGADELDAAWRPGIRAALARACRERGFTYSCLDLEGYRTGSLNEALPSREPSSRSDRVPADDNGRRLPPKERKT